MEITAISDIHGNLLNPETLPKADVLTISGDLVPADHSHIYPKQQRKWFEYKFFPWCEMLLDSGLFNDIVFIAGNHDRCLEREYRHGLENIFREELPEHVYYLRDSSVIIDGIEFYGTPWTSRFCNWYFMGSGKFLRKKFSEIPDTVDILLSHGPPLGYGDSTEDKPNNHLGSYALAMELDRVKPSYCLFGHIHTGDHSLSYLGKSTIMCINVSVLDEQYNIAKIPININI